LCVDGTLDWLQLQTLVRSMSAFHKTLIVVHVQAEADGQWRVDEMAMASEHAPFRHHNNRTAVIQQAGQQVKRQKM
jgi:hypothetical protein